MRFNNYKKIDTKKNFVQQTFDFKEKYGKKSNPNCFPMNTLMHILLRNESWLIKLFLFFVSQ